MTVEEPLVLRHDRADGLTTLTLNRPGQFNSLSKDMLTAVKAELDAIAADAVIRVVVIAGAGKAFCAGHDLKEMRANHSKAFMQALFKQCGELMLTITQMPQPVIARVHGIATAAVASWCRCVIWRWPPMSPSLPFPGSMSVCSAQRPRSGWPATWAARRRLKCC